MATKKELAGANFEMTLRTLKLLNSEADDSVKNKVHYSPTAVKSRLKLLELNLMEEIEMLSLFQEVGHEALEGKPHIFHRDIKKVITL